MSYRNVAPISTSHSHTAQFVRMLKMFVLDLSKGSIEVVPDGIAPVIICLVLPRKPYKCVSGEWDGGGYSTKAGLSLIKYSWESECAEEVRKVLWLVKQSEEPPVE